MESVRRSQDEYGGPVPDDVSASGDRTHATLGDAVTDGLLGQANGHKMGATTWLATRHGIRQTRLMCVESILLTSSCEHRLES